MCSNNQKKTTQTTIRPRGQAPRHVETQNLASRYGRHVAPTPGRQGFVGPRLGVAVPLDKRKTINTKATAAPHPFTAVEENPRACERDGKSSETT